MFCRKACKVLHYPHRALTADCLVQAVPIQKLCPLSLLRALMDGVRVLEVACCKRLP